MNIQLPDLPNYKDREFAAEVNGQKMRVILRSVDSKNAHITNYYHPAHIFKMKLSSFLSKFSLVP